MLRLSLAAFLVLAACGDDDDTVLPPADATPEDATDPAIDAALADATPGADAPSIDATPPGADAAPVLPGCPATFASCAGAFIDRTADTEVTIEPADRADFYVPGCITVKVGTKVIVGASSDHPFSSATCSPASFGENSEAPVTFTPDAPGIYGFFCPHHGDNQGTGMAGAVRVVE